MKPAWLTLRARIGHKAAMRGKASKWRLAALLPGAALAAGCITVNAPSEPIVIELNINVTQEIIYRLAEDVRENIDLNPEIF